MTLTDVLLDFSIISVLLLIAAFLRRKIKFLQHYYIPAALIAGVLGLILGPQVLGAFSPVYLKFSDSIGQWSSVLIAIVFAASFLGVKLGSVSKPAFQTFFAAGTVHQLQVVGGLTLTFLLSFIFTDLEMGFGLLPSMGFYGGHGMAIASGGIYENAGYMASGTAVGATFATIGMLVGVIAGMAIINYAAQRGMTKVEMKREDLPEDMKTGYVEPKNREAIGKGVTTSSTLDPLASQLMLIGLIVFLGHNIRTLLISISPFWNNLPLFASCLIISAIFTIVTGKSETINNMIDRKTITRISGTALDFMIASVIAMTSLEVFAAYGIPLIITSIGMVLITLIGCFIIGKYILPTNDFFETGIGLFGQTSGNLATGLMLLKVVDPDYRTNAATNITSSSTLGYTFQLQYTLILIPLIMANPRLVYIWSVGLLVLLLGGGLFFGKKWNSERA